MMVGSYKIGDVQIFQEEVFMRTATIACRGKNQKSIGRSVDKAIDMKVYNNHIPSLGGYINESYINLDLETLRLIDNDDQKRYSYISRNTKFLDKNLLNVFFIKLLVNDTDVITDSDIEYLNLMLTWEMNDIYVMPIIEFIGEKDRRARTEAYADFVTRMLDNKNSIILGNLNVGVSVPAYFSRKEIPSVMNLYMGENHAPTFVTLDFANQRISDTKRMGVVRATTNYFIEKNEERYFLYGLGVKPFKRGDANPIAEDMHLAETGFNAFGGPHGKKGVKRYVPPPQHWGQLGKVFGSEDFCYHSLIMDHARETFLDWSGEMYSIDTNSTFEEVAPKANPIIKRYNFCQLNQELKKISEAIRKNDNDFIEDVLKDKPKPPK